MRWPEALPMTQKRIMPVTRSAVAAVFLCSFHPMLEGCAGLPPITQHVPDSGAQSSGGARDAGRARDGGLSWPDAGINRTDGGTCPADSETLYVGGGPVPFNGELFSLETTAGNSAGITISDAASGRSTYVSVPQWGNQTITFAGKTMTIQVNEMSDSFADIDIYGC